jgi:hypothetical protein
MWEDSRMVSGFATCDACSRHVRAHDSICPFCRAPISPNAPVSRLDDRPGPRRSRAAILASAALAVGCSSSEPITQPAYGLADKIAFDGGSDAGMAEPVYGAPVADGGLVAADGGTSGDASIDDGGRDDGGLERDGAVGQPVYGTPAPP